MPFETGRQKSGGRKKGVSNKNSVAAKEAFQIAFDGMGGAETLMQWGKDNPSDFYKIYGRLIPIDTKISGSLTLGDLITRTMRPNNASN